ncbi:MAG TPA: hypothetical protein DCE41_12205 [Cytophagales bacterium]|nr:hypothetical protein [Cytophagales bacterium]HAP59480.1 hypothetical protein [Cytophagales bacterium]
MKMLNKFTMLLFWGAILGSCYELPVSDDFTFVRHKGTDMPVWVKGQTDAEVFLIYLHGGPGGSSFIDIQNQFFAEIEETYAVVYYDQRASGNSLGQSDRSLLTLDQFVEDLDVVVQFVQTQYSPKHIVLMGHSWGGTLGTAYLLDPGLQDKISGWIEVDGGHSLGQNAYQYSRDYVLRVADSLLQQQQDVDQWEKIKAYYDGLTSWRDTEVILDHSGFVTQAGGYFYDEANREGLVGVNQVLLSETDFLALLAQNKQVVLHMDVWHYDFTEQLAQITIPTLLLWGQADGILPVELAHEAQAVLNLPPDQFYIFQESAHSPHYEQTELFNEKVIDFIREHIK